MTDKMHLHIIEWHLALLEPIHRERHLAPLVPGCDVSRDRVERYRSTWPNVFLRERSITKRRDDCIFVCPMQARSCAIRGADRILGNVVSPNVPYF